VRALNLAPLDKGVLRGTFDLELQGGLIVRGCLLFQKDGNEWVGLPGRPRLDRDGRAYIDPKTGKKSYEDIFEFASKEAKWKFLGEALETVKALAANES